MMTMVTAAATIKLIEKELSFGPCTAEDLASVVRLTKRSVNKVLVQMRVQGKAHVCTYERWGTRVWGSGPGGLSMRIYKPLTPAQRARRYRKRISEHSTKETPLNESAT